QGTAGRFPHGTLSTGSEVRSERPICCSEPERYPRAKPSHELEVLTAVPDAATASSGTLETSRTFRPCCTIVLSCLTTSTSNEAIAWVGRDLLSRNSASV